MQLTEITNMQRYLENEYTWIHTEIGVSINMYNHSIKYSYTEILIHCNINTLKYIYILTIEQIRTCIQFNIHLLKHTHTHAFKHPPNHPHTNTYTHFHTPVSLSISSSRT